MNSLLRRSLGLSLLTLSLSACGLLGSGSGSQPPSRQPLTATRKPQAVIGLALGGGASKGFAHIGVIKVLEENNIPVKIVTGTSAGALVGSLYASGMNAPRLQREAENLQRADLVDLTLSTANSPPWPPNSTPAAAWYSAAATPARPCAPPPASPTCSNPQ